MEVLLRMLNAFNYKLIELEKYLGTKINMSLKFILHHGKFSRYNIKYFNKLYGEPIIEAHRLLKNEYAKYPSYILLTNSFLYAIEYSDHNACKNKIYIPEVGLFHYL